jgi:transposase InsO family protein
MRALGMSRLPSLQPPVPIVRYEKELPGQLIHIDTKKLAKIGAVGHRIHGDRRQGKRGLGWEAVHLAIDDHSRTAFAQVLPDETADSCISFLKAAVARYAALGVKVTGGMTDNGSGYKNRFREACTELGIKLVHTRPYTPRTNGKAERLVQTSLREWAYAKAYTTSAERTARLEPFLHHYNWHRPHSALGYRPPTSRLSLPSNLVECDN